MDPRGFPPIFLYKTTHRYVYRNMISSIYDYHPHHESLGSQLSYQLGTVVDEYSVKIICAATTEFSGHNITRLKSQTYYSHLTQTMD